MNTNNNTNSFRIRTVNNRLNLQKKLNLQKNLNYNKKDYIEYTRNVDINYIKHKGESIGGEKTGINVLENISSINSNYYYQTISNNLKLDEMNIKDGASDIILKLLPKLFVLCNKKQAGLNIKELLEIAELRDFINNSGIEYNSIIIYAIKALQEQIIKNNNLENTIVNLEKRIQVLEDSFA